MTLKWLCTASNISEGMEAGWRNMVTLKEPCPLADLTPELRMCKIKKELKK